MKAMLSSQLQDARLNENEAKIYLVALELGQTSVSRLARKSGVKRTTVYLSLENLMEKGLVSAIKSSEKKNFYAEDPRNSERITEERKQRISTLMPQLLAFTNLIDKKPEIRYFEGTVGIKEVFKDVLNYPGQEICTLYSESFIEDFEEDFFTKYFIQAKISARALLPENAQMKIFADADALSLRRSRMIDPNLFKIKIEIVIYAGSKVSIASFKEKFALIIETPPSTTVSKASLKPFGPVQNKSNILK